MKRCKFLKKKKRNIVSPASRQAIGLHAIVESVWCSSGGSSIVRDLELAYRSLLRGRGGGGGGGGRGKSGNNLESDGNKERIFFSFFLPSFF